MPAATPRLYFQTLCQHEVFRVISTMNAGSLCTRHQSFHLPGNFLAKGNIGLWQEKCQEILFGRKLTGNTMNCQDNGRKF